MIVWYLHIIDVRGVYVWLSASVRVRVLLMARVRMVAKMSLRRQERKYGKGEGNCEIDFEGKGSWRGQAPG